jgi:hypothetical protein
MGSLSKITEVAPFWGDFSPVKARYVSIKKHGYGFILGDFITYSSGHPAHLHLCQWERKQTLKVWTLSSIFVIARDSGSTKIETIYCPIFLVLQKLSTKRGDPSFFSQCADH